MGDGEKDNWVVRVQVQQTDRQQAEQEREGQLGRLQLLPSPCSHNMHSFPSPYKSQAHDIKQTMAKGMIQCLSLIQQSDSGSSVKKQAAHK